MHLTLMRDYRLSKRARRRLGRYFQELLVFTCCSVLFLWVAAIWGFVGEGVRFYVVASVGAALGPLVWMIYRLARLLDQN